MLSVIVLAGIASAALIGFMLRSGRAGALDHPNHRSLHAAPVPRSGGLGVLLATAIGLVVFGASTWLIAAVGLLGLVSWADDQASLPVGIRFAAHFCAASLVVWGAVVPSQGLLVVGMVVLGIVWMTNLYNFMDGANGLAGGMALIGFGTMGIGATAAGAQDMAAVAACIAAGAAGFLWFNFNPARIFLGDVGSIPLGFLAAVLGLAGAQRDLWPLWFPVLIFSPFIVDASITLLRRALRGEKVWQAHRSHYYQRLVQMGWSHKRLALFEYLLMATAGGSALALRGAGTGFQVGGLTVWVMIYGALILAIDRRWYRSTNPAAKLPSP